MFKPEESHLLLAKWDSSDLNLRDIIDKKYRFGSNFVICLKKYKYINRGIRINFVCSYVKNLR